MTRPMEVQIHPPIAPDPWPDGAAAVLMAHPRYREAQRWRADRAKELQLSWRKRLTGPELAAEFWHASQVATYARARIDWGLDNWSGISADRAEDIEHVLQRFAELPHFDEDSQ
ncbi:hypothetical protein [Paenarthrobacter ureafaciens]|uniref:hypothetical protein n=1 Tax=Paenarthrobacter ureafaciens TaxID=37931 RepID=UPI001A98F570|nr:hypothetical protein [Paenarthrobacter ureafaciens]QSZ53293.1 hypothetical protein AYX19_09930 [Paenarthrobacter ureafaciens]